MKTTDLNYKPTGKPSPAKEVLALADAEGIPEPAESKPLESEVTSYPHDGGHFEVSSSGVFWCKGNDAKRRICDELRVEAKTSTAQDESHGLVLTWTSRKGKPHKWIMPMSLAYGDSRELANALADGGLRMVLSPANHKLLREYLVAAEPEQEAVSVEKVGWHGTVYVTPGGTIGGAAGERIEFQAASGVNTDYGRSGTAEGWLLRVAALAIGNSRVVLGICAAFAGPLLHIAGEESGGLHLMGPSSCGKTTVLRVAASVCGSPGRYMRQWRATANGLEAVAGAHNDGLLILDEINQANPLEVGAAAYMLANGNAKIRMTKTINVRASFTWRGFYLSSGEDSLTTLVESTGKRSKAGQEIRLATVPADAGAGHGAFENLHGHKSGSAFAVALGRAAEEQCGTVNEVYLRWLVEEARENPDGLKAAIRQGVESFAKEYMPEGASGQAERLARRFGLLAAAGELATAWGLTGWEQGEADRGCGACYRAWLKRAGSGSHEDRELLEQVRGFLEQHGASRFQKASDAPNTLIINRAGWYREENGIRQYLVPSVAFKQEVVKGHDPRRAVAVLREVGILLPGSEKSSQSLHIAASGQKSTRVYVLVLPEEEEA